MTRLTDRQLEIVTLLAGGHTKDEVAAITGLSARTVKAHATTGRYKLGVEKTRQFARALVEQGYVTADDVVKVAA